VRARPPLQQRRQRPHEDVEPAIGLQVTHRVGDDLVGPSQPQALPLQHDPRVGIGPHFAAVDAVVDDFAALAEHRRQLAPLPVGGATPLSHASMPSSSTALRPHTIKAASSPERETSGSKPTSKPLGR